MGNKVYDYILLGLGPSNLGLAALLYKTSIDFLVIDKKERFCWHGESLLHHAKSQTSFLKDLVTPIDSTLPLSFLSYLHNHGLLYVFMWFKNKE
ncbi:SidA/IucD/PvdA family monooxygenase [Allofrancisella frigidaquae]|uniref:Uncharacterized protein n=1 Tax=Allofrancisella frigidaquae TaxID=1085644 RepID=A0A6M3HX40_9GAMM|nr:SidA/IucD/PvdA family monooxygenase [Allofrancisella frigidaquae]QIV94661.1 hypothetical protein E3E15_04520 [Allofrancisella frigidaquae]